eukprot:CAMPEP_0115398666 /NCGR_PEP_ID=MMETSP0271-20121206/14435_1 /TAXON_ID=71861 /ORGANISM="Scrippsiella trochoidea, Strain CCMP3099" /LENGTH=307 /DNA_ID=CAMNT_0002822447 /DNA_START=6 /DNA_END=928 /DNA_ORIENTATION=-
MPNHGILRTLAASTLLGSLLHPACSVNHGVVSCVMDLGTGGSVYAPSGHDATVTVESWIKITGVMGLERRGSETATTQTSRGAFTSARTECMLPNMAADDEGASPADGEWHHVALAGSNLYVDGQLSATGITNAFQTGTADDMWVGNYEDRFNCCGMGGSVEIHDFRIWSTERTAQEIAEEVEICNLDLGTAALQNVLAHEDDSVVDRASADVTWTAKQVEFQCPTESKCPPPEVFPENDKDPSGESMPMSIRAALQQGAASPAVQGLAEARAVAAPQLCRRGVLRRGSALRCSFAAERYPDSGRQP